MGHEAVSFLAISLAPVLLWAWSVFARMSDKIPVSSSSDMFALYASFDFAGALDSNALIKLVQNDLARPFFIDLIISSLVLCLCVWGYCIYRLEPMIIAAHPRIHNPSGSMPWFRWIAVWVLGLFILQVHLWIFAGLVLPWHI